MCARKVMPVLPQEDPGELEERTQEYFNGLQPRNALERDLVCQAARLSYAIERAERIETAHRAGRVREALQTEASARQLEKVHELGRRLLYIVGPGDKTYPQAPFNDNPAVFVRGLEETVEGCRWLLERWAEFHTLLQTKRWWSPAVKIRFIRLQGKQPIEAFYDPWLNSFFRTWEVLDPDATEDFWSEYEKSPTLCDPAYWQLLEWQTLVQPPENETEAWAVLNDIVDEHVKRLEELVAKHEAISKEQAAELADRAAFDGSKEFERHRRYQSARTRELLRTLDTLRKMRNEAFGMGNEEEELEEDEWQIAEDESEAQASQKALNEPKPGPAQVVTEIVLESTSAGEDNEERSQCSASVAGREDEREVPTTSTARANEGACRTGDSEDLAEPLTPYVAGPLPSPVNVAESTGAAADPDRCSENRSCPLASEAPVLLQQKKR